MKKILCHDIEGNTFEISSDQLHSFRPSVYGVIIRDEKILLIEERNGYDFPGGGMVLGETIHEALVREVKEETGLDATAGNLIAVTQSFFKNADSDVIKEGILMYYTCAVADGETSTEFFDEYEKKYANKAEWIDLVNISRIHFGNLAINAEEIIDKAKSVL